MFIQVTMDNQNPQVSDTLYVNMEKIFSFSVRPSGYVTLHSGPTSLHTKCTKKDIFGQLPAGYVSTLGKVNDT